MNEKCGISRLVFILVSPCKQDPRGLVSPGKHTSPQGPEPWARRCRFGPHRPGTLPASLSQQPPPLSRRRSERRDTCDLRVSVLTFGAPRDSGVPSTWVRAGESKPVAFVFPGMCYAEVMENVLSFEDVHWCIVYNSGSLEAVQMFSNRKCAIETVLSWLRSTDCWIQKQSQGCRARHRQNSQ